MEKATDPRNRCQAVYAQGQCPNKKVEGSDYCEMHGANKQLEAKSKKSIRDYQLSKWRDKLSRFSESANIKSLNEEVGILRMTLETVLNRCENDHDLILQQANISKLVVDIDRVVNSCTKIEQKMGQYIDQKTLFQFASEMIALISDYVKQEKLDEIGKKMLEMLNREPT